MLHPLSESGLLFLFGIFSGVLSGLLGIGGGQVIVPLLTLLGLPLVQATATSLVAVLLTAVSGSIRNLGAGELNWRVSLILALFGIATAQLGAWLGDRLADAWVSIAFAVLLVVTIYLMRLRQQLQRQNAGLDRLPSYRFTPLAGIGLLAGLLSGLFGVGGGVVMVPLQMLLLGETIKTAVQTSLGAIVAIAVSSLAQHAYNGNVLWVPGLTLGLGGIIGAQFGTRLLPRLSDRLIGFLFRSFLIALAIYMATRGIRAL